MSDWLQRIEATMQAAACPTSRWRAGDGQLLVSPHTGRLLACALPGVADNLFWHNPRLEDPSQGRELVRAAGGSLAGDRLWIAPEAGFIFTDLQLVKTDPASAAQLPAPMDPADWRIIEQEPARLRLGAEMTLTDHRLKQEISLRVSRQFSLLGQPFELPASVKHLGFAIRNELTLLQGGPNTVAGVWDLLQIPPVGWMICPTLAPVSSPRCYFEPFDAEHLRCERGAVRLLIDGRKRYKMGLAPWQTTGRAGYHRKLTGRTSALIVRVFAPQPGEPYVDVPVDANTMLGGDAFQAYNDSGAFGGFGEIEYHDPGMVTGCTPPVRIGGSVTHVFAGPTGEIRIIGQKMLGVRI